MSLVEAEILKMARAVQADECKQSFFISCRRSGVS